MTKILTLFEKSFVNFIIAELKSKKLDVDKMISNLKATNPELAAYAEAEKDKIPAQMVNHYSRMFRHDIAEACNADDNPSEAANRFFKQIGATATKEFKAAVKKQLQEKKYGKN